MDNFDTLMHQILAHDPMFSVSAIVNCFIDGLKPDIRSVVLIHRPLDLDTAILWPCYRRKFYTQATLLQLVD